MFNRKLRLKVARCVFDKIKKGHCKHEILVTKKRESLLKKGVNKIEVYLQNSNWIETSVVEIKDTEIKNSVILLDLGACLSSSTRKVSGINKGQECERNIESFFKDGFVNNSSKLCLITMCKDASPTNYKSHYDPTINISNK